MCGPALLSTHTIVTIERFCLKRVCLVSRSGLDWERSALGKCPIVLVVQLGNNTHIHLNDDMEVVNVVAFNANKLAALYETQF